MNNFQDHFRDKSLVMYTMPRYVFIPCQCLDVSTLTRYVSLSGLDISL